MTSEHEIQIQGEYIQRMFEAARKFSTKQRKQMAGNQAMPDGSFPIKNAEDLKNAIKLAGNAKNPGAARAHIIRRAKALGLSNLIPDSWKKDKADMELYECPEDECDRAFLTEDALSDHADSVHTYDEIQRAVGKEVRSRFARPGSLGVPSVFAWVVDISDTWVVFTVENEGGENLYRSDYTMDDSGKVTLGDPTPVVRKIVYVPAPKDD